MKTKFEKLWNELEAEAAGITETGILKRLIGKKEACPMFLGVRNPTMERAFILQVPREFSPLPESIPESKGFNFTALISGDELMPDYVSVIISASGTDYNDIFASISEDLYTKLHTLTNIKETVTTFLNRVRLWQLFFEKQSAEGLTENAQKGLYGELLFLNKYLLTLNHPAATLLRYWTGPKDRQHDFQFGSLSVEVKTTSAKQHQKLHISSEQQLDDTLVDKLYLFYVSVSLIEGHDETLPALINNIREALINDTTALTLFNSKLLERGYLDIHSPKYEHIGYSQRKTDFFDVTDDFPRIREAELRKGVGDVGYSVTVAECSNYIVSETEFMRSLQEVIS